MSAKLTPELLNSIAADPIIVFYMKMSNMTQCSNDNRLPSFSDTSLRLAVSETYGQRTTQRLRFEESTLQIYRRLLLYHYSDEYESATELRTIMNCFKEADIKQAFECVDETIMAWFDYLKSNLIHILFKEAFLEIMLEWAKRYYHLHGELKPQVCSENASDLLEFLFWDSKFLRYWLPAFRTMLHKADLTQTNAHYARLTPDDLCNRKITCDIQNRLSPLLHKFVLNSLQLNVDETALEAVKRANVPPEPPIKVKKQKIEVQKVEVLKPISNGSTLNVPVFIKEEGHKTYQKCNSKVSVQKTPMAGNAKSVSAATVSAAPVKSVPKAPQQEQQPQPQQPESKDDIILAISDSESDCDSDIVHTESGNKQASDAIALVKDEYDSEDDSENDRTSDGTISRDKAICYIARLQGYALHNGYVGALELLDQVDTIVRNGQLSI